MAERRMFAKTIIDSDAFLNMPLSTQSLYFHLSMRADDDGFINNPIKISRMIGCGIDDYNLLLVKKFIIPFDSGVCVIKHWKIHNYIQKDRYKETMYQEEKSFLSIKKNNSYTMKNELDTQCIQDVSSSETQVRLGKSKDRLGKSKVIDIDSKDIVEETKVSSSTKVQPIIEKWNSLGLTKVISIKKGSNRYKELNARATEFGQDKVLEAINNINKSKFLRGDNDRNWIITFDWLVKPNNFIKVLEGNYTDKNNPKKTTKPATKFDNFEGREYDYDSLEKKLLGWDDEIKEVEGKNESDC